MSQRAFHWAWSQTDLKPTEKLVLCEIADGWNDDFGYSWAGQPRMASRINIGLNTLKRTIQSLVAKNLVAVVAVKGTTNRYSLPAYPGQNGLTPGQNGLGQNGLQTKIEDSSNKDKGGEGGKPIPLEGEFPSVHAVVNLYNQLTPPEMPGVREASDARIRRIRTLLKKHPDESFWHELFTKAGQSEFLRGKKNNGSHKNWVADFDFLVRDNVVYRVIEGSYS